MSQVIASSYLSQSETRCNASSRPSVAHYVSLHRAALGLCDCTRCRRNNLMARADCHVYHCDRIQRPCIFGPETGPHASAKNFVLVLVEYQLTGWGQGGARSLVSGGR